MWGYINQISSLEEKASAQVAINLCQDNGFKEVALCLEKPTYGVFISVYQRPFFVSDPEKLAEWAKVKEDDHLRRVFMSSCYLSVTEQVKQWDTAVDEQCQRLTEVIPLPDRLRQKIHPWMNRSALEYLSFSRRQEVLFGVSRYFLMDIFARGDWKEAARLDERKLAQRLLEDERLTVLQRYRIACVYCLHVHIPQLWERLTQEEKQLTTGYDKYGLSGQNHGLVLLSSRYMKEYQNDKVAWPEMYLRNAMYQAICDGDLVALMVCWKEFREDIRQKTVFDMALKSLRQWQYMKKKSYVKQELVSYQSLGEQSVCSIKNFNLPSYYSELVLFFLSQTDEEQKLTFFEKAFQSEYCDQSENCKSVLEYFLEWPHQDNFLPTIKRLWGIIPKNKYGQCLLALASKYSGNDTEANCDYDYRSLLWALWEETPEEYKQYVFHDKNHNYSVINEGKKLLSQLLERSPFQEKDEALFKRIFHDQPQEKRRAMMHSAEGRYMCSLLMQKEKWSFLNGLLEESLSKEEIPDCKKQFMHSDCGVKLCLDTLKENREKFVKDLLDWSLESHAEKMQYKDKLIENNDCVDVFGSSLLFKGKLSEVENVINFCLSSDEKKERFKVHFAQTACDLLYSAYCSWSDDYMWEQMDTIISWSIHTEEKIRDFKKVLFSRKGIDFHYRLIILQGNINRFYQWFGLSPEEIKQLKRDTLFFPRFIKYILKNLPKYKNKLVDSLRWLLTDEEMVINLKKAVEEYSTDALDERDERKKEQVDHLVSKLLDGFRKQEVQDKTGREGIFVKDTGEKRSSVEIEDEYSSPRKRQK